MTSRQNELRMQNHIITSYANQGGVGYKNSMQWAAHVPDLTCCFGFMGLHLVEVKHLPDFKGKHKNVLTPGQREFIKRYRNAYALVFVFVVAGASDARGSKIGVVPSDQDYWEHDQVKWYPYVLGKGYDIASMLKEELGL